MWNDEDSLTSVGFGTVLEFPVCPSTVPTEVNELGYECLELVCHQRTHGRREIDTEPVYCLRALHFGVPRREQIGIES